MDTNRKNNKYNHTYTILIHVYMKYEREKRMACVCVYAQQGETSS